MTVELTDRIEMANSDELDALFDELRIPEGFKAEIVEGIVHMTPQRDTHWEIIRRIVRVLEDRFGMDVQVKSDVRIDFPGHGNGLCPDVAKLGDTAEKDGAGRWRCHDVEFVAEVISKGTGPNDYGPKLRAYATAGVPVYLIADPYTAKCHLYTEPQGADYERELTVAFGQPVDMTKTLIDLVLSTEDFPRERPLAQEQIPDRPEA